MALVNDKLTGVVFASKRKAPKSQPKKVSKPKPIKVEENTRTDDDLRKELADTKAMLQQVINILKDQQNQPQQVIVQQIADANAPVKSQGESDIFGGVKQDINIDTKNKSAHLNIEEEKRDSSSIDDSLDALENVLNND